MAKDKNINADKALQAEQEAHAATKKALEELNAKCLKLASRIEELENATAIPGELLTTEEPEVDEDLLAAGLNAYGIGREHLFGAGMDPATGQVVLVTAGGSKARWPLAVGEKPAQLTAAQISGIPGASKRKPVAGRG